MAGRAGAVPRLRPLPRPRLPGEGVLAAGAVLAARRPLPAGGPSGRRRPARPVGQPLRAQRAGPSPSSTPTSRPSAGGARRPRRCCGPTRSTSGACTRCCGPRSSGACAGTPGGQHGKWELAPLQRLADYGRARGLRSLTDLDPGDPGLRKAAGREGARIACAIAGGLHPLYVTPEETREAGYILTGHFGRKLSNRPGRIDLDRISQRWLRDLVWDHFADVLRSPSCPRSGSTFDHTRRAGLELSAFLEARRPRRRPRPPGADRRAHAQVRRRPAAARARRADLAGSQGRARQAVDRDRQHQAGRLHPHPAAPARGAGVRRGRTGSAWTGASSPRCPPPAG